MRVLIAIDSFKGSMSSLEAAYAAKFGILRADPSARVDVSPIADGGEGTMHALKRELLATERSVVTINPIKKPITAKYYVTDTVAIMDMSESAGITLLTESERKRVPYTTGSAPMHATTFGVGLMIKDAILDGYREFYVGIGGSVTNDGGIGMLQALGFSFLDEKGEEVPFGACGAGRICQVNAANALKELADCHFTVLCDVKNPLLGKNGCSHIFAPQKGASERELDIMDGYLKNYAEKSKQYNPSADPTIEGSGAAGGMGFAFVTYLNSTLKRGIDVVCEVTQLEERIKGADIVITGEGKMDGQSASGKAPIGVAALAKKHGKRVIALCGITGDGYEKCLENGIDEIYAIADPTKTLEENIERETAIKNIERKAFEVFSKIL